MDIWSWVNETEADLRENGHGRLADLMDRLPHVVLDDQNDEVEAMVPDALGLARSLDLPWVEVFVRHWQHQALGGGFATLADAIDLLDFSHGEKAAGCPQSICVVQDVARAYQGADGPGFAQDRLDVAEETLGRIDPTWPCFACISGERATALIDAGRPDEVAGFIAGQRAAAASIGADAPDNLEVNEASALLALGRPADALATLEEADRKYPDRESTFSRSRRLHKALALVELGRHDEARAMLLDVELVAREPNYVQRWAACVAQLVAAGAYENDWRLGSSLERMLARLVDRGMAWDAVLTAAVHGDLALRRGAPSTARHALDVLRTQAARLRDPARAGERIAALEAAIAAHPARGDDLPATAEQLLSELDAEEAPDPEAFTERLARARERWPDDEDIAGTLAGALETLGRPDDATAVLREFAEAHLDDFAAQVTYGFALMSDGALAAAEEVATGLDARSPADAAWLRANLAMNAGDFRAAATHGARVVELDAESDNARRLLAHAYEQLGDYERALEQVEAVIARADDADDVSSDHWRRILHATALGRWEVVRSSSAAVGIELDDESGPIEEDWGMVRLRFDARELSWAVRTGPVTAEVWSVDGPGAAVEHAGDRVLFDPRAVDPGDDDLPPLFRVIDVTEPGGMRAYALDGFYPGDEAWQALADVLRDEGWAVERRSPDEYRLYEEDDEDEEGQGPGLYAFVAVPAAVDDAAAHRRLTDLTNCWPQPFTWLGLAEAAGDEATAAEHRELAERYALY